MAAKVRAYHASDLDAFYAISLASGLAGGDASALYRDTRMMGHIYSAPYVVLSPSTAFVAEDADGVAGFIVGVADTTAFEERLEREWWPALRQQYADPLGPPESWNADQRRCFMIHHPSRTPGAVAAAFPAHVHMNLLPRRQGQGVGPTLLQHWLAAVSVGRIHVGINGQNVGAVRFWQRHGFDRLDATTDRTIWMGRSA
jgi:GNAT superfamily N-acetyltransferase